MAEIAKIRSVIDKKSNGFIINQMYRDSIMNNQHELEVSTDSSGSVRFSTDYFDGEVCRASENYTYLDRECVEKLVDQLQQWLRRSEFNDF